MARGIWHERAGIYEQISLPRFEIFQINQEQFEVLSFRSAIVFIAKIMRVKRFFG
jgi:hypothetical protein